MAVVVKEAHVRVLQYLIEKGKITEDKIKLPEYAAEIAKRKAEGKKWDK